SQPSRRHACPRLCSNSSKAPHFGSPLQASRFSRISNRAISVPGSVAQHGKYDDQADKAGGEAEQEECSTITPQVSMAGRLFQISAMLDPIAVKASVRSLSSIGIENALIAKEKAANRPPTTLPTISIAHPVGVVNSIGTICPKPGNGTRPKNNA